MSSRNITPNGNVKALVLAGGKGTRLRPLTYAMAKQLVPVANKPILHYALDALYRGGVREFGIIISPETGDMIRKSVSLWQPGDVAVEFIVQDKPAGLAHAVRTARPYLGDDDFIMYLGDNLINGDLRTLIDTFRAESCDASILLKPVSNPSAFGVAELDGDGSVIRLVEKPKAPPSNLALVGVYLFNKTIFSAIDQITPSRRGELEITDAIQKLIETGRKVRSEVHQGWWLDTGKKDDMLAANRTILSELTETTHAGTVSADTKIVGQAEIGAGTTVTGSKITGPVRIGLNCTIQNAVIGPYTSIGDGCEIIGSAIQNSVILNDCRINNLPGDMAESLIGHGCRIEGPSQTPPPKSLTHKFLLADHSEIQGV